jgi:hypothetical protein
VPQPSRLDFVINPGSKMDPLEAAMRGAGGGGGGSKASKAAKSKVGGLVRVYACVVRLESA